MKTWFDALELRERLAVVAGGAFATLVLAWAFAWTPLRNATTDLSVAVTQRHSLLGEVRRLEATATLLPAAVASTESLVLVVDQTHRAHGLGGTLSRNQPDGEDAIRVSFRSAPFAQLVSWLGALWQDHTIVVESATLDGAQQPGLVNASLVLRRP